MEQVGHTDVEQVYENLMRGSSNHLRAFATQISSAGDVYDAQYLTQAEFDAIAESPKQTGNDQARQVVQPQIGPRGFSLQRMDRGRADRYARRG